MSLSNNDNHLEEPIQLLDLLQITLNYKKFIIVLTAIIAISSALYTLSMERIYVAQTLVKSTSQSISAGDSMGGGLAGLLGLQGQAEVSGSLTDIDSTIAIMNSRPFLEKFIIDNKLLPEIFDDLWDKKNSKWYQDVEPNLTDGYKVLKESLEITFDPVAWTRRQVGYVLIDVSWNNSKTSAYIANKLVEDINLYLSNQMVNEAQKSIIFIDEQALKTNANSVKESLYKLKTEQLRNMMLANSSKEFALRVIDNALPPKIPSRPKRTQIVLIATSLGFLFSVLLVFLKTSLFPLIKQLKF